MSQKNKSKSEEMFVSSRLPGALAEQFKTVIQETGLQKQRLMATGVRLLLELDPVELFKEYQKTSQEYYS